MATPELIEYVRNQANTGHSLPEIRDTLIRTGWSQEEVDGAITIIQSESAAPQLQHEALPKSGKPAFGLALSVAAGLLIIFDTLRTLVPSLEDVVINIIQLLPLTTEHLILTFVSGILLIAGAFLAYKGFKRKISALLVIIFSVIYLISAGYILFFIIGIIGGILVLIRK